jgi:peptide/nickel transport system substrate-binding protein
MIMKKGTILIIGLLIALLVLNACSQPAPNTSKPASTAPSGNAPAASLATASAAPKTGGILKIADVVFPSNLSYTADPTFARGGHALTLFFDTILKGDINGKIYPNLATAWSVAPDKSSITLTLMKGVKFHDGSDWNATSAKWNIDMLISGKVTNYLNFASVDIVDDYTIKINLKTYTNTLLSALSGTYVVSKAAYDAHGGGKDAENWMRNNAVGTGPFKFVSYQANVAIKASKFADYWQKGKPYLDGVEFNYISDPMTRASSLQAGEMDTIGGDLSKTEYDLQQKGFTVVKGYIAVNTLVPDSKNAESPLANLKVRQAIDYAIDREAIVKSLGYGFWATTYQYALPGTATFNPELQRPYDQAKAKQLLAEAGYPNGAKIALIVNTSTSNRDAATAIQASLSKVGIIADTAMVDGATAQSNFTGGWKNGLMSTGASILANVNFSISSWTKENPWYVSMDKTEDFYNLYKNSLSAQEYDVVQAQKAIKYLFDNAAIMPVFAQSRGEVMSSKVHDSGFFTRDSFWFWEPANTWLSAK